eukprot:8639985-Karenia_brevis.AAC.1
MERLTNAHPVTRRQPGFGSGTESTERFVIHSDPGSHTPTQSQSSGTSVPLAIPTTGLEVSVAKATGFVESAARSYATMDQFMAAEGPGSEGDVTARVDEVGTRRETTRQVGDVGGTGERGGEEPGRGRSQSPSRSRSRSQQSSRQRSSTRRREVRTD